MQLRPYLLAFLFASLGANARPQDSFFYDWVEPGEPRYALLGQAARESGTQGWLRDRLLASAAVPQASARLFVDEMQDSAKLDQGLKDRLRKAFPAETEAYGAKLPDMRVEGNELRLKLAELEPLIGQLDALRDKNNYSPQSTPQGVLNVSSFLYGSYFDNLTKKRDFYLKPGLWGNAMSFDITGKAGGEVEYSFHLAGFNIFGSSAEYYLGPAFDVKEIDPTLNDKPSPARGYFATFGNAFKIGGDSNIKVSLNPAWFNNLNIQFGNLSAPLDELIFSGVERPTPPPFFSNNVVKTELIEALPSDKAFSGFYLRKLGASGWWFFNDAQFIAAPAWYGGANLAAGRLDFRGLELGLVQDSNIWASFVASGMDKGFSDPPSAVLNQSDNDYSLGLQGLIPGGGYLTAEIATAHYTSQGPQPRNLVLKDLDLEDQAYTVTVSKAFSLFTLFAQSARFGPYYLNGRADYFSGGRKGLWSNNEAMGNYYNTLVDDPRPANALGGKLNQTAFSTVSRSSGQNANNSQKFNAGISMVSVWGSLGLSGGFAQQILPSGPWVQTSRSLGNTQDNGHLWFDLLGGSWGPRTIGSSGRPLDTYNLQTVAKAYYNGFPSALDYYGNPTNRLNWHDLQQTDLFVVDEMILLSRTGVGDLNLREDSIKVQNNLRLTGKLDLQAILHARLPFLLQGYCDLRDIDESIHPARFTDSDLLAQSVTEIFLSWGWTPEVNFQAYGGYESWLSKASAFPVATEDYSYGLGWDFLLTKLLDGLVLSSRVLYYSHQDINFALRNFKGWNFNVGAQVSY